MAGTKTRKGGKKAAEQAVAPSSNGEFSQRDELEIAIRSRAPIIFINSWDTESVLDAINEIAGRQDKFVLCWSITEGLRILNKFDDKDNPDIKWMLKIGDSELEAIREGEVQMPGMPAPVKVGKLANWGMPSPAFASAPAAPLNTAIRFQVPPSGQISPQAAQKLGLKLKSQADKAGIFVLLNFSPYISAPDIQQLIHDVYSENQVLRKTVIVVEPTSNIPANVSKLITVMKWTLPTREELAQLTSEYVESVSRSVAEGLMKKNIDIKGEEDIMTIATAMQGMYIFEARRAIKLLLAKTDGISASPESLAILRQHKKEVVEREGGALEYWESDAHTSEIGGLDLLKKYIEQSGAVIDDNARAFAGGDDIASRGVLAGGPPGTGKSLVAKKIATTMRLPLLRLDFGKLFGPLLGQSEATLRNALAIIEAISPCVLWLDEIEKGLSTGADLDGGTSSRILGAFLTWMQEDARKFGVFVIATANWIDRVDPAMQQRFSERFFIDLPGAKAREDIIRIHLAKRGRTDPESTGIDVAELVEVTRGFAGREIEEAILAAMRAAWLKVRNGEAQDVTQEDFLEAVNETVPLSIQRAEELREMRAWGKTARRASSEPFDGTNEDIVEDNGDNQAWANSLQFDN